MGAVSGSRSNARATKGSLPPLEPASLSLCSGFASGYRRGWQRRMAGVPQLKLEFSFAIVSSPDNISSIHLSTVSGRNSASMDGSSRIARLTGYDGGMKRKLKWPALVGLCLLLYVVSYLALSRVGYARAQYEVGFWYVEPTGPKGSWYYRDCVCRRVYAPLNAIDCWIGIGRHPWTGGTWALSAHDYPKTPPA
jgi:hypothetical protein